MTQRELADFARPFQQRDGWPECANCAGARSVDCEKCFGTGYAQPDRAEAEDDSENNQYIGLEYDGDGR